MVDREEVLIGREVWAEFDMLEGSGFHSDRCRWGAGGLGVWMGIVEWDPPSEVHRAHGFRRLTGAKHTHEGRNGSEVAGRTEPTRS